MDSMPLARLCSEGEKNRPEQVVRGGLIRGGERIDLVGPTVQIRAALRRCAGEHEPSNQQRTKQDQLLGDMAAEREPEEVDPLQAERIDEGDRIPCHIRDVLWNRAGRATDAAVVQEDDLAVPREAVDEQRVPAVEVAAEVLQHHQRQRVRLGIPEAAIGERDVAYLDRKVLGRDLAVAV